MEPSKDTNLSPVSTPAGGNEKSEVRLSGTLGFQASLTALTHIFLLPLGIFSVILVGRLVGPQGKGILTALLLVPAILPAFGLFSISSGLIYYTGNEPNQKLGYQSSALIFGLCLTAIYGLSLWACRNLVWDWLLHEVPYSESLAMSMVAAGTLMLLNAVFMGLALSRRDISRYNLALFTNPLVKLLLVLASIIMPAYLRLNWLAWAAVVGIASATAIYAPSALRAISAAPPSLSQLRRMLSFSLKSFWGGVIQKLDHELAKFIVAAFLNPTELGFYAVSLLLTTPVTLMPSAISPIIMPYATNERYKQADEKLFALARVTLWFMVLSSVLMAPIMYVIINYGLGKSFLPALLPAYLLFPGMFALGHSKIIHRFLTARGYPLEGSVCSLISLVTSVGAMVLLLPLFGISGAAMATSLGYIFYSFSLLFVLSKLGGYSILQVTIPHRTDMRLLTQVINSIFTKLQDRLKR